jgi:hypothetical protein
VAQVVTQLAAQAAQVAAVTVAIMQVVQDRQQARLTRDLVAADHHRLAQQQEQRADLD